MSFRPLWYGGGWGWRTVHIVSVDATLSGSGGQTKRKPFVLKHTHAYRLHIDHLVSSMYEFFFLCRSLVSKSWHRSSNYPKAQKAHIHIQLTCECLTYRSRILPSVYLLLTSSFQMHCQLSGSTMKWCQSKTQKFCTETFSAPIL